jgi:hypothetical protein
MRSRTPGDEDHGRRGRLAVLHRRGTRAGRLAAGGSPRAPCECGAGGGPTGTDAGTAPSPAVGMAGPLEQGWWWDLDLEGAAGRWLQPGRTYLGMGRARVGVMYMAEPWYYSLGATYELNSLTPAAFGAQVEAMHLWSGFWIQLGGGVDVEGQGTFNASVWFSLFGFESETWSGGSLPTRTALLLKLRLPVSWILQIGKPPRIPKDG